MQQQLHHILSTVPYLLQSTPLPQSLHLEYQQQDEFSKGYIDGSDEAYADRIKRGLLFQTPQDVWQFLGENWSPEVVARDEESALGTGFETPLAYRAGFTMGYLHTMFAPPLCPHLHTDASSLLSA